MNYNSMFVLIVAIGLIAIVVEKWIDRAYPKARSIVGYSKDCWQEGNVLHVITAKGDTVRLDIKRLEGE